MKTEENLKTEQEVSLQQEVAEKSEEVQAIIDRMPTYWVKWVALCVGVLMGIIVLLGFLIQYPDTVDGQISVTATAAPLSELHEKEFISFAEMQQMAHRILYTNKNKLLLA